MNKVPPVVHTDSSGSGSSGSAISTPQSGKSLADFLERNGFSPLKNGDRLQVSEVVGRGNSLLEECGLDSITIQNEKTQFIKLAFLIARNQDILLRQHFANDPHTITRLVGELFDETTPRWSLGCVHPERRGSRDQKY